MQSFSCAMLVLLIGINTAVAFTDPLEFNPLFNFLEARSACIYAGAFVEDRAYCATHLNMTCSAESIKTFVNLRVDVFDNFCCLERDVTDNVRRKSELLKHCLRAKSRNGRQLVPLSSSEQTRHAFTGNQEFQRLDLELFVANAEPSRVRAAFLDVADREAARLSRRVVTLRRAHGDALDAHRVALIRALVDRLDYATLSSVHDLVFGY